MSNIIIAKETERTEMIGIKAFKFVIEKHTLDLQQPLEIRTDTCGTFVFGIEV